MGTLLLGCGPEEAADDGTKGGDGEGECVVGAEGCACTEGGACDAGLECRSGLCVAPDGDDGGDDGSGGGTGGSGDDGDGATGGDDGGTTGDDPPTGECADATRWADLHQIWIANSSEGTVSKIDTDQAVELARYQAAPGADPQPSRTAVNLYGDVAVASRGSVSGSTGHVVKIAGHSDDCVDRSGNGELETSGGPMDVLPWMTDECLLWAHEVPSDAYEHGPRPLGWERGADDDCGSKNVNLWIGWYDFIANLAHFELLDGSNGDVLEQTTSTGSGLDYGPYGGVMDGNGDFWAVSWQQGPLWRVRTDAVTVDRYELPQPPSGMQWSYGIALDQLGNPWVVSSAQIATFDAGSEQWSWVDLGHLSMRGIAADREDRIWVAVDGADAGGTGGCGLGVIDAATKTVAAPLVEVTGCVQPVGVAIDADGYVWVVDQGANQAFKVDPDSYQIVAIVTGLVSPYTYSDMTGANLYLVVNPPG